MKVLELVHRFGCVGYTLLAAVISFLFIPVSYLVHSTGNDRTIGLLSYGVLALVGALVALVVLRRQTEFYLALGIWLPQVFVSLLAYMLSFDFVRYRLVNNPNFNQWLAVFINLLVYEAIILGYHAAKSGGIFRPDAFRMAKRGDTPGLIRLLGHRDPDVRKEAAQMLVRFPDPRAFEPVHELLYSDRRFLYNQAMDALLQMDSRRAADALLGVMEKGDILARVGAAERLGRLREARSVALLGQALRQPLAGHNPSSFEIMTHENLRKQSAGALEAIGTPAAAAELIAALQDDDLEVRVLSAHHLIGLKDERAVPLFSETLKYSPPGRIPSVVEQNQLERLHRMSAAALARTATPEAQAALKQHFAATYNWVDTATAVASCSENLDPELQAWGAVAKRDGAAVEALGEAALPALLRALRWRNMAQPCDRSYTFFAARILGRWGRPEAAERLLELLQETGEIEERLEAVELLAEIGGPGTIRALEEAANNGGVLRNEYFLSYEKVQKAARAALEKLAPTG